MSATTDIYITPSTSLVLIRSLTKPVNVYFRDYATYPFSVTVRDATGLSSIQTMPVRLSTIEGARFADGTSFYALNQPYGLVSLSLRTSNVWQIQHTSGQSPAFAAADIGTLSAMTTYVTALSSVQKNVSSLFVENLLTPNSISVTAPFVVTNLSTPGFVLFEQSFNVYGPTFVQGRLFVSSLTNFVSSLFAIDPQPIQDPVRVLSTIGIGGFVQVGETIRSVSTLSVRSTVQVEQLFVTLSSTQDPTVIEGSVQIAGLVSTLGNLIVASNTTVSRNVLLGSFVSSFGGTVRTGELVVGGATSVALTLSSLSTTVSVSSVQESDIFVTQRPIEILSTLGVGQSVAASSMSSGTISTFGSVSTGSLELISTATLAGTLSTAIFQSLESLTVGGKLESAATVSSLGQAIFRGEVSVIGSGIFKTLTLFSSVGVGSTLSVVGPTFVPAVVSLSSLTVGSSLETSSFQWIGGSAGVRSNVLVEGTLLITGTSEIPSFRVQSFLLSNLELTTSSPEITFRVSSLQASSLYTGLTRIEAPLPDVYQVSSTYASTLLTNEASATLLQGETLFAQNFYVGSTVSLSAESDPKIVFATKTLFTQGISSLQIQSDSVQADTVIGNFVGSVSYLSNIAIPFSNISGITIALSTLSLEVFTTSSFHASTLSNAKNLFIQSTLVMPYLVFESQGFLPRYDVHQILEVTSSFSIVNRNLYFDRQTGNIGLFISSPGYEFDVDGLIYASNIQYSSINPLYVSSPGTTVFSTVFASSVFVRDAMELGPNGLAIEQRQANGESFAVELGRATAPDYNLYGIYSCLEQSTILINQGISISRDQRVGFNAYDSLTETFLPPVTNLDVRQTARTVDLFPSSVALFDAFQTASLSSPYLTINGSAASPVHSLSSSIGKLSLDSFVTIQSAPVLSNRYLGIHTHNPTAPLDVRGTAYFSSVRTIEQTRAFYVAIGTQEL